MKQNPLVTSGYVSVASIDCVAVGKRFNDWTRTLKTRRVLESLAVSAGVDVRGRYGSGALIEYERGGRSGIWISPVITGHYSEFVSTTTARSCHVYLIHAVDSDFYKIGISANPAQRMRKCQSAVPFELRIVKTRHDLNASQTESTIHNEYKTCHVRGEWFQFDDSMLKAVIKKWFD